MSQWAPMQHGPPRLLIPGWYAVRSWKFDGKPYTFTLDFRGPFRGGETECRAWCEEQNKIMTRLRNVRASGETPSD